MSGFDDFYVFLTSNVETHLSSHFPNKIGQFYTKLSEKLYLSDEYEVALTEITYTRSWLNIPEDQNIELIDFTHYGFVYDAAKLKAGSYENIEQLIKAINDEMKKYIGRSFMGITTTPSFEYDKISNKVSITLCKSTQSIQTNGANLTIPRLPKILCEILGLVDSDGHELRVSNWKNFLFIADSSGEGGVLHSKYPVQLQPIHTLYVYSDIIRPNIVGDIKAPLLRQIEIPNHLNFGDDCVLKYDTPYYHPLNHHEIDSIKIDIKDDTGEDIDFTFGRTTATLHFRKKKRAVDNLRQLFG